MVENGHTLKMDIMRIMLLILVFLLVISLALSLVDKDIGYVTIVLSGVFCIIVAIYMYIMYYRLKGPGQNKISVGLARLFICALLPIVALVVYVLSTNVYSMCTAEADHDWVLMSNVIMAIVLLLLYAVVFPFVIPRVCPMKPVGNVVWRMAGFWPKSAIRSGECTYVKL
jgi:hypothetical protein